MYVKQFTIRITCWLFTAFHRLVTSVGGGVGGNVGQSLQRWRFCSFPDRDLAYQLLSSAGSLDGTAPTYSWFIPRSRLGWGGFHMLRSMESSCHFQTRWSSFGLCAVSTYSAWAPRWMGLWWYPRWLDCPAKGRQQQPCWLDDHVTDGGEPYVEEAMRDLGGSYGRGDPNVPRNRNGGNAGLNKTEIVLKFLTQVQFKREDIEDTYDKMCRYVHALLLLAGPSVGPSQQLYTFES